MLFYNGAEPRSCGHCRRLSELTSETSALPGVPEAGDFHRLILGASRGSRSPCSALGDGAQFFSKYCKHLC